MKEIKKVGVLSLAKISCVIGVIIGLIAGIIMTMVAVLFTAAMGASGVGGVLGIFSIIVLPIFYGTAGFVVGAIYAFMYNVIAKRVGGIEIELA